MNERRGLLYVAMAGAIFGSGLLGGYNVYWGHLPHFPVGGIAIDLLAVPAIIGLILYVRRVRCAQADEFSVTKKRIAAQTGLVVGAIGFVLISGLQMILPAEYHALLSHLDGAEDGYEVGRVVGMAPFVIGVIIGQIVAWSKFR